MKNLTITPPEGYEIDKEQSTFENIIFKPLKKTLPKTWEELKKRSGYYTDKDSYIREITNIGTSLTSRNVFATKEQAEASIALAQLSQLMKVYNDGWVPNFTDNDYKYSIQFFNDEIEKSVYTKTSCFLLFKTRELRDEFLDNFEDLILTAKPLL